MSGRRRHEDLVVLSTINAFPSEHRQFPAVGSLIVTYEISITVCAPQFEVPVVGRQPRVEHLDIDATAPKNQRAWRLLAAVTCIALDTNTEQRLFSHRIILGPTLLDRWRELPACMGNILHLVADAVETPDERVCACVRGCGVPQEESSRHVDWRATIRWQDQLQEGDEVVGAIGNPR